MPWCPECGYEYVDGFEKCPECGVEMLDEPPALPAPPKSKGVLGLEFDTVKVKGPLTFLYYADSEEQAEQLTALVQSAEIPVVKNYTGQWAFLRYVTGRTPGGVELLVPERCIETAREILGLNDDPVPYIYRRPDSVEPPDET